MSRLVLRPDRPQRAALRPSRNSTSSSSSFGYGRIAERGVAGGAAAARHPHARVERDHAALVGEQRIDVELGDSARSATSCATLISVARSRRGRPAAGRDSRAAAWRPACCAIRSRASARLSGGSASALSRDDLDRRAALAEQDHRAERGSTAAPTISSCASGRRIIGCTVKPRAGPRARAWRRRARIASPPPALGGVRQVEAHAADIGFVRDVGRQDLERHRKADLGGGGRRLVGVGDAAGLRRPGCRRRRAAALASGSVSHSRPLASALVDHGARRRGRPGELLRHRRRRLASALAWLRR